MSIVLYLTLNIKEREKRKWAHHKSLGYCLNYI